MDTTITALPPASGIDPLSDWLAIDRTSLGTTQRINRNTILGISGTPVGTSDSQTLTNKILDNTNTITLKDTSLTLQDDGNVTKQGKFNLSAVTAGQTRTYTLPNASVTLASLTGSETLTNKTLTSPVITGGSIDNSTITVDSIAGHTTAGNGTVYGLSINSGIIQTSNSVTATALADNSVDTAALQTNSVTPSKLSTGATTSVVITSETTTSTSYTGLTTPQTLTVTVGNNGLLLIAWGVQTTANNTAQTQRASVALSGANTVAASDNYATYFRCTSSTSEQVEVTRVKLFTGLSPGSTTIALQFRTSGGTSTWLNRELVVIPL